MNLLARSQNVYISKILIAQFGCISVAVSQKMTSSILLFSCICHLYQYHRSKSPMTALPLLCLKKNKQSDVAKNFSVTPHFSWLNVLTHMGHLYYPLVLLRALLFCVERPSCAIGSEKSQPTLWCFITLIVWQLYFTSCWLELNQLSKLFPDGLGIKMGKKEYEEKGQDSKMLGHRNV